MEDLFTAVLSPNTSQPPQLPHPPNTAPNASATAMSLQNPGIKLSALSLHINSQANHPGVMLLCACNLSITCKMYCSF